MRPCHRIPRLCAILLTALLLPACAPRQQGASPQSFYASGLANFSISVSPPLTLAASGRLGANVPADEIMGPRGIFNYAVFAEEDGDRGRSDMIRSVHAVFSELPRYSWRWEKETWSPPQTIADSRMERGGKFWTVRILPVDSSRDWFSALWRENGRDVPEFWLAKRWSATPEENMRVLAEYREPAPACMRQRLLDHVAARSGDKNAPSLRGEDLRPRCVEQIDDFSARADLAVRLDRMQVVSEQKPGAPQWQKRPTRQPDMGKLVGRAQAESNDSDYRTR